MQNIGAAGVVIITLLLSVGWVMNIVSLANCDFKAPYKAEVVHVIGVVLPLVGGIVGWMDLGN